MADTNVDEKKTERPRPPVRKKAAAEQGKISSVGRASDRGRAGGYFLWRYFGTYESTDDAQIDGHVHAISARISGHVNEVLVEDQQIVKAGDVLVKIDPRDYQVAVAKAEADLADAEAASRVRGPRFRSLRRIPQSTLETARASRVNADAGLAAARRQFDAAEAAWKRPKRR